MRINLLVACIGLAVLSGLVLAAVGSKYTNWTPYDPPVYCLYENHTWEMIGKKVCGIRGGEAVAIPAKKNPCNSKGCK